MATFREAANPPIRTSRIGGFLCVSKFCARFYRSRRSNAGLGVVCDGLCSLVQERLDLGEQSLKDDRLALILITSGRETFLPVAGHREGRQGNDRDYRGFRQRFQPCGGLISTDQWYPHIHQDQ